MEEECITITVSEKQRKERLDLFLADRIGDVSRSKIKNMIKTGNITVNGKSRKPKYLIKPHEKINIVILKSEPQEALAEEIPLEIIFEDESLLVINKKAGMVVHPAYGHNTGTLVNALLAHCKELSGVNDPIRPGIVHRIDKDTSGLLVVAKNDKVHKMLADQFSSKTVLRKYTAVVWGGPKKGSGTIDTFIARSSRDRKKMVVREDGKRAVTHYKVINRFKLTSCMDFQLETGRTHQIRVHSIYSGYPLVGDQIYGGRGSRLGGLNQKDMEQTLKILEIMQRQALHAKTLGFKHPESGKDLFFDSVLPEDMKRLLDFLSG